MFDNQVHDIINQIDDGTGSLSFTDFCQVVSYVCHTISIWYVWSSHKFGRKGNFPRTYEPRLLFIFWVTSNTCQVSAYWAIYGWQMQVWQGVLRPGDVAKEPWGRRRDWLQGSVQGSQNDNVLDKNDKKERLVWESVEGDNVKYWTNIIQKW